MLVKELLKKVQRETITTSPETSIKAAMDILLKNQIACLAVLDNRAHLIGIIRDRDIFKKIHETKGDYQNLTVKDLMSDAPILGTPDDDLGHLSALMKSHQMNCVVVVEADKVVGLITQEDIVQAEKEESPG